MSLLDILACPLDHEPLVLEGSVLRCPERHCFEVRDGVPVMLQDPFANMVHEGELQVRDGYERVIQSMIDSIPRNRVVLDIGSGNRRTDDPRIVRLDPFPSPHVDVIGDAHALPFRDASVAFVHASAVFEHLRQPFTAADEIWRVLQPGGYVLADCNFVFPFHGYPAVYFNASYEGLRQLFRRFTEVTLLVAPWQMPSYALDALVSTYLHLFRPQTDEEERFACALRDLSRFPVKAFDARFDDTAARRIAAGTTYLGVKQPAGHETLLPEPVLDAWRTRPDLLKRFPDPLALATFDPIVLDNLFRWAATEGTSASPAIDAWFRSLVPFERGRLGS